MKHEKPMTATEIKKRYAEVGLGLTLEKLKEARAILNEGEMTKEEKVKILKRLNDKWGAKFVGKISPEQYRNWKGHWVPSLAEGLGE